MHVRSLIRVGSDHREVEIELSLVPGLPQLVFIGLPDAAMRESALRIRSAIRAQGFKLPKSRQILVQLRPTYLRKSSRGLDLAVAAALLWETGQLPIPLSDGQPLLYGELTLKGEVVRPDDLNEICLERDEPIWTGQGPSLSCPTFAVTALTGLRNPLGTGAGPDPHPLKRPSSLVKAFAPESAELAAVIAAGEHSALLAGPHGSGKSTLIDAVSGWIESPSDAALRAIRKRHPAADWRPAQKPHHSITPLAMIGGGTRIWAGEIARANGGILILEELLLFHPEIQEALREPMESGSIVITRGGTTVKFNAQFITLASTNLCDCGKFVPGRQDQSRCRCSSFRRRKSLARLTGPFSDRFALLAFTNEARVAGDLSVSVDEIQRRVQKAIGFRKYARSQELPNAWIDPDTIEASLGSFQQDQVLHGVHWTSRRRLAATLRVARTLADLDQCEKIANSHLERALDLCVRNHRALEFSND